MELKRKRFLIIFLSSLFIILSFLGLGIYEYLRIKPNDVHFSNVTSSSVTVSWNTKKPTSASVIFFEGDTWLPVRLLCSGKEKFYDTRDVTEAELEATEKTADNIAEGEDFVVTMDEFETEIVVTDMGEYYTHHVSVTGLDPETEYSFMVGDEYLFRKVKDTQNGYTTFTLEMPETVKGPLPAYGSVKNAENKEDVPIDELSSVTDGIVYFNYLDETSGERSAVYSSSLNSEGNWYLDASNAVGQDGEHFISRFGDTITNIFVELVINTGPLGKWKKIVIFNNTSPTDLIVINDPLMIDDEEYGVERLESQLKNDLVKGVNAGSCLFADYCGPCYEGVLSNSCPCPEATLKLRNCSGESTKSMETVIEEANENTGETTQTSGSGNNNCSCSGGGAEGQYVKFGNECKECTWSASGDYCLWKKRGDLSYAACANSTSLDGHVFSEVTNTENPPIVVDDEDDIVEDGQRRECYKIINNRCRGEQFIESGSCRDINGYTTYQKCLEILDVGSQTECYKIVGGRCEGGHFIDSGSCDAISGYITSNRCQTALQRKESISKSVIDQECYESGLLTTLSTNIDGVTYYCVRREWKEKPSEVDVDCSNGVSTEDDGCSKRDIRDFCYDEDSGKTKKCVGGDWQIQDDDSAKSRAAVSVVDVENGERCLNSNCYCKFDNEILTNREYCRETKRCKTLGIRSHEGEICLSTSGRYTCQNGSCERDVRGVDNQIINEKLGITNQMVSLIKAEESGYIIDSQINLLSELEEGLYIFDYEGEKYAFEILEGEDDLLIYLDTDEDGEYNESQDIKISDIASKINIILLEEKFSYSLIQGLNFVTFPFLISTEEQRTGAGLLQKLNEVYSDSIYSISKFDGGKWKIVGQNDELYGNNDFQLLPGEGYIIKAKNNVNIKISGQPVQFETEEDSAPINLNTGWNLIGLYGTNVKSYTAKTLLENVNDEDFEAINVTQWVKSKQLYEGFQVSEGTEYGFDFPLNTLESYFVRITEGSGNWQPELGGNN